MPSEGTISPLAPVGRDDVSAWLVANQRAMLLQLICVGAATLISDGVGGTCGMKPSMQSVENVRLRAVQRAVRDGLCTSTLEDAAIEAIGGPHASTYGELTPQGVSTLCSYLHLGADDNFVDCGSGLGRVVVQVARECSVQRSIGIEYAGSRHRLAIAKLEREADYDALARTVMLLEGDCADRNVWDAQLAGCTVAYVSNLLFDRRLNQRLQRRLQATDSLRAVASLRPFPDGLRGFGTPSELLCESSWSAPLVVVNGEGAMQAHQGSPVYIYKREPT